MDDHPAVREGLALLVSTEGMEVCAQVGGRAEAITRAEENRPHLAVVDLSLDGEDGLMLLEQLRARGVPGLVYSMHADAHHVQAASWRRGSDSSGTSKRAPSEWMARGNSSVTCVSRF